MRCWWLKQLGISLDNCRVELKVAIWDENEEEEESRPQSYLKARWHISRLKCVSLEQVVAGKLLDE